METTPSKFASWSLFASSVLVAAAIIAGAIINRPSNTPLAAPLQTTNAPPGMVIVEIAKLEAVCRFANAYATGALSDDVEAFIKLAHRCAKVGQSYEATTNLIATIRANALAEARLKP